MSTQQKRHKYNEGDIKITEVTMGDSTLIDVQEVGNPEGYIRYVPPDGDVPAVKR